MFYLNSLRRLQKRWADEVTRPRPEGDEDVEDIQVMLNSNRNPSGLRDLKVSIFNNCITFPLAQLFAVYHGKSRGILPNFIFLRFFIKLFLK